MNNIKYKVIKNFLCDEEIKLLTDYCRIKHRLNIHEFDFIQNNNADTSFYGDPIMESLMINKLEKMQKETSLKLLPTYSYWRMYTVNSDLKKHKDRNSCEISVTVMINSDETKWPIFIENNEILLNPGDAVIYLGCELEHWREKFIGDWQAQVFLHYVNENGPNREWFRDKRPYYGLPPHTSQK
jgi:hypothetical protein